ncbi:MAG: FHA domain-containing protein [Chloroflexi bacterium]|nr:FHA domain-containing protein [Chloroflexota bacterium]
MSDQVACPIEVLQHEIAFITDPGGAPVTGRIDIGVNARSDLGRDRTRIVFRVNDEVVQTSNASVYTFDATQLQPGFYTIEAGIVGQREQHAGTHAVRAAAVRAAALAVHRRYGHAGHAGRAGGPSVRADDSDRQRKRRYRAAGCRVPGRAGRGTGSQPDLGTAPFVDGKASLQIADLAAELRRLFPEAANGGSYELSARVPSPSAGSPALAGSNPLPLELEPAVIPTPTPARVVPRPPNWRVTPSVPLIVLLVALLLNLLLLRAIRRRRIQRVILYPDTIDLGPQLMTLTVLRDGVRQAHPLTKKTVTIGRGSSNDINISDDANVSRQHGAILWRKGEWWYSDRKSNALTRIDGKARRGFYLHRLDGVTEFQIGDVVMIFHSSAQQDIADFIKTDL